MKALRKILTIGLSLGLTAALILAVSASQTGAEHAVPASEEAVSSENPGMHTLEEYLDVTTPEQAAELTSKQNVELDLTMYIHKLHEQLIQEYMSTHKVTSEEEAGRIVDRLHEDAVQAAKESGLFPAELFIPHRITLEDIPTVPEGLEGEDLYQATAQQKQMYFLYLNDEEMERRRELGLDVSNIAMREFRIQANELVFEHCEISPDSRTITFAVDSMESAEISEVTSVLYRLLTKAETLELSVTVSCLDEELKTSPEIEGILRAGSEAAANATAADGQAPESD